MNDTGRIVNRLELLLLAAVGLGIAVVAAWPLVAGSPLPVAAAARDALAALGIDTVAGAWIIAGALALLVIVALIIVFSRGAGRSRSAIDDDGVIVDTAVLEQLARQALASAPDVVAVHGRTRLRRGRRVVGLRLQMRPRADAVDTIARVRAAVADIDAALGVEVPLVVHLTTGLRTAWARGRRVD